MRWLRIILALILLVGGYYGFNYIRDRIAQKKEQEYHRYASLIAEVGVASRVYREFPDSFYIARDSILNRYGLTIDSVNNFKDTMIQDEREWAKIWKMVSQITDSLVDERLPEMEPDSLQDTTLNTKR